MKCNELTFDHILTLMRRKQSEVSECDDKGPFIPDALCCGVVGRNTTVCYRCEQTLSRRARTTLNIKRKTTQPDYYSDGR